jgi:hypothetical protein
MPLNAKPAPSANTKLKDKPAQKAVSIKNYGKLPMAFEANEGQTDKRVRFFARGHGYQLFLEANRATMRLKSAEIIDKRELPKHSKDVHAKAEQKTESAVLGMNLVGANKAAKSEVLDRLPGVSNYFIGKDPSKWHKGVANYGKVKFNSVYPGIDIVYYGNQGSLEHDFVVAPGANPDNIRISFDGAKNLSLDKKGNLVLTLQDKNHGQIQLTHPIVYQMVDGKKVNVAGRYVMKGKREVGFKMASYDKTRPLTIDPVLFYSTFIGGNGFDSGNGIATEGFGFAFVVGTTDSTDFPTTTQPSGRNGTLTNNIVFVTKFRTGGEGVHYSTVLGGVESDTDSYGAAIAVNDSGFAFVTGSTTSPTFAGVTISSYQNTLSSDQAAFVSKLDHNGNLLASTYLQGTTAPDDESTITSGEGIGLRFSFHIYVTGSTNTTNFPTTGGQTANGGGYDAYFTKLNNDLQGISFSTYLGSNGNDYGHALTVNTDHEAYVVGETYSNNLVTTPGAAQPVYSGNGDAFLASYTINGTLTYLTYLGGSNWDAAYGVAHRFFDAYITGETTSSDFPVTAGALQTTIGSLSGDAFVTRLTRGGNSLADLIYSTFVGGSGEDWGSGIAVDFLRNAYVAGSTASSDMFAHPSLPYSGGFDAYAFKLLENGNALAYSIYLGGSSDDFGNGIASWRTGPDERALVTGQTYSPDFPISGSIFGSPFDDTLNSAPSLTVFNVKALAVPSDGFVTALDASIPPNHVLFYGINSLLPGRGVDASGITLIDRFQKQFNLEVEGPFEIGNPVAKIFNGETDIEDDSLHYLTYFVTRPCEFAQRITAQNQFHSSLTVALDEDSLLMVPASKNFSLEPPSDDKGSETHFRCYYARAHQFQNPAGLIDSHGNLVNPLSVGLDDEFTDGFLGFTVIKPTRYCVAVQKWHDGVLHDADIQDNENGFMCYEVQPVSPLGNFSPFTTLDQFGPGTWTTNQNGYTLCVPSIITSR